MSGKIDSLDIDEKINNTVLRYVGNTPLVRVNTSHDIPDKVEIYAKLEYLNPGGSVKDRPVLRMIKEAIKTGELTHGKAILDSTSGNAGVAYSMIGAALGYGVDLVIPGNASKERMQTIRAYGATIITTDPVKGYDEAIRKAHEMLAENPDKYYMPDQYANECNPIDRKSVV